MVEGVAYSAQNTFNDQACSVLLPGSQPQYELHQNPLSSVIISEGEISNQNMTINVWPLSRPLKTLKEAMHVWFSICLSQKADLVTCMWVALGPLKRTKKQYICGFLFLLQKTESAFLCGLLSASKKINEALCVCGFLSVSLKKQN
jgi:hypothetical protein